MHQSITYTGLVNIAWLRIINLKGLIAAMPITLIGEILVKLHDIIQEIDREIGNVLAFFLAVQKFLP